ncbi:MAG: hypothetical protein EZS28_041279, partial [Streblomastix strix]
AQSAANLGEVLFKQKISLRKCMIIDETENAIALPNLGDYGNKFFKKFLKKVYTEENVRTNLMAVQNVALIFAPTLMKSKSEDPSVMVKNLRLEISFIMKVITEIGNLTRDEESKIVEDERWILDNKCKPH